MFLMQKRRHDPVNEVLNRKYNCESRKIFGVIEIMKIAPRPVRGLESRLQALICSIYSIVSFDNNHLVCSGSAQLRTAL